MTDQSKSMTDQEILYTMALTRTPRLNVINQRLLLDELGSATAIFENRKCLKDAMPDVSDTLQNIVQGMEAQLPRAEQELGWARSKNIQTICLNDERYPARLRECQDAPALIYYLGNADLNATHVISMVGTRQCTEYGKDLCKDFMRELKALCPDVLIMSGLAYGIDINSHRAALKEGLNTIGVLAHGLDQIYPRLHKDTAIEMLSHGGLLTEYMSGTAADKMNFVARNRIVAGMADATIVVESAAKGGSLITARIANDYNREVFAFPGRIGDTASAGCNALIQNDEAHLILSAQDMMNILGWKSASEMASKRQAVQTELFLDLSPQEEAVMDALKCTDGKAINQLSIETATPIGQLSALLFNMEMRGLVRLLNGGMYKRI